MRQVFCGLIPFGQLVLKHLQVTFGLGVNPLTDCPGGIELREVAEVHGASSGRALALFPL